MGPKELMRALDEHDALIRTCVRGDIGVREFIAAYDCFYHRAALDGHEGNAEDLLPFADRIEVHRLVYEHIDTHFTTEEHAANPEYAKMGWIGEREALVRLREIARQRGLLEELRARRNE